MSSKLVRKGLDLVNSEESSVPKKRKAMQRGEKPSYRRKQNSSRGNTNNNRTQPRGFKGLSSFSGDTSTSQQNDHKNENLHYFMRSTAKIDENTFQKILERQKKLPREKSVEKTGNSDDASELSED
ncbi:uncharacterized protein LOC114957619 [Acropora millepora]|uniref:uncharacterized protein LOC114957619 n=1 Tax=Acropora millepora TaxID=45264 RepID=UPI0010FC9E58|nr:uncharacterized protein LOC114957619 [Acropora millepora]